MGPKILNGVLAADAAIWTEQQLVDIPGWLCEDQNARLHQEGQFASIKEPRSPTTIRRTRQREELFTEMGRGTRWRPKPFPHHPVSGNFWANIREFS
jgi:hypothetical protein